MDRRMVLFKLFASFFVFAPFHYCSQSVERKSNIKPLVNPASTTYQSNKAGLAVGRGFTEHKHA